MGLLEQQWVTVQQKTFTKWSVMSAGKRDVTEQTDL